MESLVSFIENEFIARKDFPEFSAGDTITVGEKSKGLAPILASLARGEGLRTPEWLSLNAETMQGQVLSLPSRSQISTQIEEQAIVEYYSR